MTRKREQAIHWPAVLAQGTGLFETQTPQHVEARRSAWKNMGSAIDDAEREGADTEFIRACTLYLAELAAVNAGQERKSTKSPKGGMPRRTPTSATTTAFDKVKRVRRSLEGLLRKWIEARDSIGVLHTRGEIQKVDAAFVTLMKRLDAEINAIGPVVGEISEPATTSSHEDLLHCLSGLRRYLQNTIGTDRPLLHKLASSLNPPLPFRVTSDHLRSVIHQYRRRHHTTGPTELARLQKEFKKLQHRFVTSA